MHVYVSLQRPGPELQKNVDSPQLQFIAGHRHLFLAAEADLHGPVYSADHRYSAVDVRICGRCPCCAGRAVSQVLSWRRHSCSHSCSSLRNCSGFPGLQFIMVVGTPFMAQMLIRMVLATMENPQLGVDRAGRSMLLVCRSCCSGLLLQPLVFGSHLYGVRCSPLEYRFWNFLGGYFRNGFRIQHSLVYNGCMLVSVYEAFGRFLHVLDPRISAQCLVRQRILAHASDYRGSGVEVAVLAVDIGSGMCKAGLLCYGVEETAELPLLKLVVSGMVVACPLCAITGAVWFGCRKLRWSRSCSALTW